MGGGSAPYIAPAQPDPAVVAMQAAAQRADAQAASSDLSTQTNRMAMTFGSGVTYGARGASATGAINGLSSVAFMPLGMSR